MIKKITFIILLITFVITPIFSVKAITPGTIPNADDLKIQGSVNITQASTFLDIIAVIVTYTYELFFIVAVLFILVAAFYFLTASEDTEKIKKARTMIMYAVIAIVVALLAVGASLIIRNFLSGGNGIMGGGGFTPIPPAPPIPRR
jgi:hypothetical protein